MSDYSEAAEHHRKIIEYVTSQENRVKIGARQPSTIINSEPDWDDTQVSISKDALLQLLVQSENHCCCASPWVIRAETEARQALGLPESD